MRLELQKQDHFIFADRVLAVAHHHKTMKDLSDNFGMSAFTMRYKLGKARKLDKVKAIIKGNRPSKASVQDENAIS